VPLAEKYIIEQRIDAAVNRSYGEPEPEGYSCAHEHICCVPDACKPLAEDPLYKYERSDEHDGHAGEYGGTIYDEPQIVTDIAQRYHPGYPDLTQGHDDGRTGGGDKNESDKFDQTKSLAIHTA
jgi:hypothetical protein